MAQNGESSSSAAHNDGGATSQLFGDTTASAINPPGVVVLDRSHREDRKQTQPNPKEDLWLTTVDGRYSSPPIPIRVGQLPNIQTFYVRQYR